MGVDFDRKDSPTTEELKEQLDQIQQEMDGTREELTAKEGEQDNKCVLKGGYNCEIDRIRQETEETRELFNKQGGGQAKHYVLGSRALSGNLYR